MLDPTPYQGPASCYRCGKELPFGYSAATVVTFCDDCIPKLNSQQVPVSDGVKSQPQSAINPFKATIPIPADPGLAKFILETHTFEQENECLRAKIAVMCSALLKAECFIANELETRE